MNRQPLSFTTKYDGLVRELKNEVYISPAFDPKSTTDIPQKFKYNAIWDTGATNCVITQRVIDDCNLRPISMARVCHAGGESMREVFLVNLFLPNNLIVALIKVTLGDLPSDSDVLIGMDIIVRGDFAVTNKSNKTVFTFRYPSIERIDFVKEQIGRTGRNDPCPCGSGKKYKKCHGSY